jgi:hypothetical protein
VLPCQNRVLLTRAGGLRCHSPNSGLGVGEDGDPFRYRLALRRFLEDALGVAGGVVRKHGCFADG